MARIRVAKAGNPKIGNLVPRRLPQKKRPRDVTAVQQVAPQLVARRLQESLRMERGVGGVAVAAARVFARSKGGSSRIRNNQ
jgi:hypothetical protein